MKIKIIDKYIIRKFLGTFFFALGLIIAIAIVFDISEKIDDFLEKKAPLKAIVFDYYLNFIPYFGNLFSPLFVFIAVIFFTSRMAGLTEVVAILSSGVSFRRFVAPYMVGAAVIASISLLLNMYVIPHSNAQRLEFERIYIKNQFVYKNKDVHRQISPGQFIYFESYNNIDRVGYRFSLEKFKDGKLTYKLLSERIVWDSTSSKWRIENYFIRQIVGMNETIKTGLRLDTVLAFSPEEFNRRTNYIETMDSHELDKFIEQERIRGTEELPFYLVEKHRRIAFPFATFILTLIGVSLSSRKVRGGIGVQIGAGILLSFTYIMFMQISQTFATNGNMSPMLAMWIPNIAFSFIAIYLYRKAMR
jgi:lipopolysaccharide export system permease protein